MSLFTDVVAKIPRRNAFNLSHEHHTTTDFGLLVPVFCQECIPGDKFRASTEAVIKLQPLLAPTMSRIDVFFHYFFVPNRLLYEDWEDFITSGVDGTSPNGSLDAPVSPYANISDLVDGNHMLLHTLANYLGLPYFSPPWTGAAGDVPPISLLPFAAYQKIYSDWFRDELLDSYEFEPLASGHIGNRLAELCTLRNRAWRKDYFTSARPDTQLGPAVTVPVGGDLIANGPFRLKNAVSISSDGNWTYKASQVEQDTDGNYYKGFNTGSSTIQNEYADGLSLGEAGVLINDLRRALRLQEWQEKNMRGGNRYIENIYHHFGVKSSDARLQRSRFLGGKKMPVMIGEVNSTVDTSDNAEYHQGASPLGTRAGVGNSVGKSQTIKFFAEEHGFFICLMSILPRASYYQGVGRMFTDRWDRFSYAWPEFGNLGEQEIKNYELYLTDDDKNSGVFGYQSRYAEYKFAPNRISGDFTSSLLFWHSAREFRSRPALNRTFVQLDGLEQTADGQNRIFAVEDSAYGQHFLAHLYHNIHVLRMLPKYGIPSI